MTTTNEQRPRPAVSLLLAKAPACQHACLVHDGALQCERMVSAFLAPRLSKGVRCLHLAFTATSPATAAPEPTPLDGGAIHDRGDLLARRLPSSASGLSAHWLESEVEATLASGCSGLCVIGELPLDWSGTDLCLGAALEPEPCAGTLPVLLLCLLDAASLPASELVRSLQRHHGSRAARRLPRTRTIYLRESPMTPLSSCAL